MNKYKHTHHSESTVNSNVVNRAHSTLSVSAVDYYLNLPSQQTATNSTTCPPSPSVSTITLTPGRVRNIDQDMETLRASRQDNPFIQQIIASRESLIDNVEEEADHVNLMSKELSLDLEMDPFALPEMHEHMIRSPPPTNWPKSPNFKAFQFPNGEEDESIQVEIANKLSKSELKMKHATWDGAATNDTSPLRSFTHHFHHHQDRFSLLASNSLRSSDEDSIRLMAED